MTSKRPRQLTKVASGGDALYAGFFLWKGEKKKVNCLKDNPGLKTAVSWQVGGFLKTKQSKTKQNSVPILDGYYSVQMEVQFAMNNLNKQVKKILTMKI